jgi:endonuclease/exonuclease/phosphatase (EEP) superfamily protein YafD
MRVKQEFQDVYAVMGMMVMALLAGINLLSVFSELPYLLELLTHFRIQFALLSLLLIPLFLMLRRMGWLAMNLLLVAWNLVVLVPWYLPGPPIVAPKSLKILLSNVYYYNYNTQALKRLIEQEKPDLVILQELHPRHLTLMNGLARLYPYRKYDTFGPYFGLGIWSRRALTEAQEVFLGPAGVPSLYAKLSWQGQALQLLTTHPFPPTSDAAFQMRNAQYQALSRFLNAKSGQKLLIGDLNLTPWSPYYQKLEHESGLRNARLGFGLLPSWPVAHPIGLRIPIDHALVSPSVKVLDVSLGPDIGSDHLPLLLTLGG